MKTKLAIILSLFLLSGCGPLVPPPPAGDFYTYKYEIGFTNFSGEHIAVSNLVVSGNGSHKGTPGIYVDGKTILPFVDRGPCAAGSPCWTGTVTVPIDGKHEFTITAAVKPTRAEWRIIAGTENESHNLYCEITLNGKILSLQDDTGQGYNVTPVQDSDEHIVTCSAHN